jgi:hypothetical protein
MHLDISILVGHLGAVTGKIINSICNERVPNIDIEPFNPSRFN